MTTVTVDQETGEIMDIGDLPDNRRSLAVVPPAGHVMSGVGAIARLSDDEFEANLKAVQLGVARAARLQTALLVEGTDYGALPGIKRPFLHKPGAEKFEKAYGLATRFRVERLVGDGETAPAFQFLAHAYVHLGDFDGPVVAEGIGEANSWETKYRYRSAERVCPKCGVAAIKSGTKRGSTEREFYCWSKNGGCGARFEADDAALTGQDTGKVDNPDPWDLANTLVKMATKRAHVDGILRATGTSGLFTQDDDSPSAHVGVSSPASGAPSNSPAAAPPATGEPTSYTGKPTRGTAPVDGNLRETPDGPMFGFALVEPSGKRLQVVALRDLAEDLAKHADELVGDVTVEGTVIRVPWTKDGKDMPPYRQLRLERIVAATFTLPEDTEAELDALVS